VKTNITAHVLASNVHYKKASHSLNETLRLTYSSIAHLVQVQILVHVRPADSKGNQHFELLDCSLTTTVGQIKQQVYILPILLLYSSVSSSAVKQMLLDGVFSRSNQKWAKTLQIQEVGTASGEYALPVEQQVFLCHSLIP